MKLLKTEGPFLKIGVKSASLHEMGNWLSSCNFLNNKFSGLRRPSLSSINTRGLHPSGPPDFDGFSLHNWHQASFSEMPTDAVEDGTVYSTNLC